MNFLQGLLGEQIYSKYRVLSSRKQALETIITPKSVEPIRIVLLGISRGYSLLTSWGTALNHHQSIPSNVPATSGLDRHSILDNVTIL